MAACTLKDKILINKWLRYFALVQILKRKISSQPFQHILPPMISNFRNLLSAKATILHQIKPSLSAICNSGKEKSEISTSFI